MEDFFYRVEYQQRGSPHIHMMTWCANAPKYGENTEEEICQFIDKYISCAKPSEDDPEAELVQLQTHRHSHTCKSKQEKKCRFGYPKPPMRKTRLLEPLDQSELTGDEIKSHRDTWNSICDCLNSIGDNEEMQFEDLLHTLQLTEDQYILAVRASIKRPTVFLQRTCQETRINNYNSTMLSAWRANVDVQYVVDAYACATYVASYVTKSQRGMSELLRKATKEASEGNQTLKDQVKCVGNKFLNAVELSAQESVYICLQLPMKKSSRHVVFVNTSPPDERVTLLKPNKALDAMDDDDDDDIECSNSISRYSERPSSMENVTLADFISSYDERPQKPVLRSKTMTEHTVDNLLPEPYDSDNEDDEQKGDNADTDKDGCFQTEPPIPHAERQYRKRRMPRILRSVHFNPDIHAEKYYRELIMLYYPWRNEGNLKLQHDTYQQRYQEIAVDIQAQQHLYERYADVVDTAQELLSQTGELDDAWNELAPTSESNNAEDEATRPILQNTGIEDYDIAMDLGLPVSNAEDELNKYYELPDQQYRQHMRLLNQEQIEFVYDTIHLIKTSSHPVYRFLSGGAGVGKSFVTKALYQTALKYLNKQAGENFDTRRVLLLAPTGKAAYHIHGNTIHSALKIAPNQRLQHKPLQSGTLNTLRNQIGGVKLIFIDEISMVGFNMFNCIHQRLMEVMQSPKPFGGVSVIVVGDLFQLKPVMDSYIFIQPRSGYMPLATSMWQDNFSMLELKEIMRQADNKPFAELLNRLREGQQTNADISVLRQRFTTKESDQYPCDATHLFTTNDKVDAYNAEVIHTSQKPLFTFKAKDRVIGSTSPEMKAKILGSFSMNKQHTSQLPNTIEVSENIYYDITINLDTTDGLINGASCKMMKVDVLQNNSFACGVLWVQFDDPDIGQQMRTENRHLYKRGYSKDWTPIQPVVKQYAAGHKGQAQVQRYQFPLRPSHAKTIHRSQGDTLNKAVVNLSTRRRVDHMHYVALSRLQSLSGVYITNLQEDKISVDKTVVTEMNRLRASPLLPTLQFLYSLPHCFKVTFLNASSLHRHLEDVRSDFNVRAADVACFCETRFDKRDSKEDTSVHNFIQYRQDAESGGLNKRPSYGLVVYSRHTFLEAMPSNESVNGIEICVFKTQRHQNITFISVYKHPKQTVKRLCEALLAVHSKCQNLMTVIFGDFNIDWNTSSPDLEALQNLLVMQLKYTQVITGPTTDNGSTIDLIFTNIADTNSGTIETYYSDHKMTWISFNSNDN